VKIEGEVDRPREVELRKKEKGHIKPHWVKVISPPLKAKRFKHKFN
jgi:hypothetical protein